MLKVDGYFYLHAKEAPRYLQISYDIFYQFIKSQIPATEAPFNPREIWFRVCDLDLFLQQGMPYERPPRLYTSDDHTEVLLQHLKNYAEREGISLEEVVGKLGVARVQMEVPAEIAEVAEKDEEEEIEEEVVPIVLPPNLAQFLTELEEESE